MSEAVPAAAQVEAQCFFEGRYVPFAEARVGVMTHALNYGTACFEGIRAYWNEAHGQLYVVKLEAHVERLRRSCRFMRIELAPTAAELAEIVLQVLRRSRYQEDVYIRPLAYKSGELIGVRLHDVADALCVFAAPMGNYVETGGIRCGVSSWRRVEDNMIPPGAKITGGYVNSALAKTEAVENGYDEAIMLTAAGYVSEGSAENVFLVVDGRLVTPTPAEHLLVGVTRSAVIELARQELGMEVVERQVGRSELYNADELFLCGTGAQISPVVSVDRRPVGDGAVGPISERLQHLYFQAVRGEAPRYASWVRPVYDSPRRRPAPAGATPALAGATP
ncbi:MAG TPA: branched-chain amino acid transaminase [Chloroflexota bacterium]|nr:branched-chain amino acid transaminase [Chloroflexota bacterium]